MFGFELVNWFSSEDTFKQPCNVHTNNSITHYCDYCAVELCAECINMDKHKGHQRTTIADLTSQFEQQRKEAKRCKCAADKRINDMMERLKCKINNTVKEGIDQLNKLKKELIKQHDNIKENIKMDMEAFTKKVNDEDLSHLTKIESLKKQLASFTEQITHYNDITLPTIEISGTISNDLKIIAGKL